MKLAQASIRRPVTVAMMFIGLAMIGLFAAFRLPVEQFPEVEIPYVGLGIPYPNASTQEVERNVTRPVEEVLGIMGGVQKINTFSRPGFAYFNIELAFDKDVTGKGIEAKELVEGIRHRLPEEVRYIQLRQQDPNASPILNMMITAPGLDTDTAYELLEQGLKAELERIPGVNSVNLFGIDQHYIRVAFDPSRIEAYGLDYLDLQRRLSRENFFLSAGDFDTGRVEYRVRPMGQFESVQQILDLPINSKGIKLGDVSEVSYAPVERTDRRRVNGERSLGVSVYKKPEANLVKVSQQIDRKLDAIGQEPEFRDMVFTALDSQASTVLQSLNDLRDSGLLGGFLSVIALFLFLRQVVTSLLIASTVPLALCATLGVMYFLDMSLNILSLVGLMLAIGLLVDNSVVVSEAIALRRRDSRTDARTAADLGVSEVGMAITAGTLTTVIVFVPSFMTDVRQVAVIQQNIAIPLCMSLLASLMIAQTLVPTLMARLPLPAEHRQHPIIDGIAHYYEKLVRLSLRHRFLSLMLAIGIAFSGWWIYQRVEVNMNPDEETPRLQLNYFMRGSIDIESLEVVVDRIEEYLIANKADFEIENIFSSYDTDDGRTYIMLKENGKLSPKKVEEMILDGIPETPGVRMRFNAKHRGFGGGGGDGLSVRLIGESTNELMEIGDDVTSLLEQYPMLSNIRTDAESRRQEVRVKIRPEVAGQMGLTASSIGQAVNIAIGGRQLNRGYQDDSREIDIFLELQDKREADLTTLNNLPVFLPSGDTVLLKTIADLEIHSTIRAIRRENRETSINIQFETKEASPAEAKALVETVMERYQMPAGYRWQIGREFDRDDEMFQEMVINMIAAIVLVYMLMAALFESVLFPTTVLIAIGYSAVGVFWFLWGTGTTFTAMALTGMMLLAGIVVNNGIVLLNRIIQLRRQGVERMEAIISSGRHRLRPILMTVCTTVAGLLPLAIGDVRVGGLGPSYLPMARAIIGGLTFSTLITLLLLPLCYVLMDDAKAAVYRFFKNAQARSRQPVIPARESDS